MENNFHCELSLQRRWRSPLRAFRWESPLRYRSQRYDCPQRLDMKWIIPSGDQQHASGFEPRIFRFPRIATQFTSPNGSRTHKEELASWEHDSLTWAGSGSENILESYHKITSLKTQNEIHPLYSDISNRIQIYNLRELSLAWEGFEHKKSQTIWLNTNCWPNLPRYAYFAWKVASIWCSCFPQY